MEDDAYSFVFLVSRTSSSRLTNMPDGGRWKWEALSSTFISLTIGMLSLAFEA